MEIARPPSNSALFPRSPRRSFPNLQHLSLAPLSSRFPIDDEDGDEGGEPSSRSTPRSSYIAAKTAPTTPSILSRSNSRTRHKPRKHAHYAHDSYFPSLDCRDIGDVPKAKSSSALLAQPAAHSRSKSAVTLGIPVPRPARRTLQDDTNDEWLYRAGIVIASESRESKGQSWLVSRQSSTALVSDQDSDREGIPEPRSARSNPALADDEFSPVTPRNGRFGSRPESRGASARNSRRGSRVGSRIDMMTPMGARTPSGIVSNAEVEGYFNAALAAEPDFVDPQEDEEERENEAEVARLTADTRSGLGGIVDRLVGWSLFSVQEDGDETEDDNEAGHRAVWEAETLRRKRTEEERAAVTPAVRAAGPAPEGGEGQGAWQDAAWLLSVASKVIL